MPELTCREFIDFVGQYMEGELSGAELLEFQRHLEICPYCVDYLASYEHAVRLGKAALQDPDGPVPPEVPEELVRAIQASRRR